jgi:hypothetical protein
MKLWGSTSVALAALVAAGCGAGNAPPAPVAEVDHVSLISTTPSAIHLDGEPGPDAVNVQVFLFRADKPAAQLVKGTLEFLLYQQERRLSEEALMKLLETEPFHTWRFPGSELIAHRGHLSKSLWGYRMQLRWGRTPPRTKTVLLLARYVSPGGQTVYSAPLLIPTGG